MHSSSMEDQAPPTMSLLDLPSSALRLLVHKCDAESKHALLCVSRAAYTVVADCTQQLALAQWQDTAAAAADRRRTLLQLGGMQVLLLPHSSEDGDLDAGELRGLSNLRTAVLNCGLPRLASSLATSPLTNHLSRIIITTPALYTTDPAPNRLSDLKAHILCLPNLLQQLRHSSSLRHLVVALPGSHKAAAAALGSLTQLQSLRILPPGVPPTPTPAWVGGNANAANSNQQVAHVWGPDGWRAGIWPLQQLSSLQFTGPLMICGEEGEEELGLQGFTALKRLEVNLLEPRLSEVPSPEEQPLVFDGVATLAAAHALITQPGLPALQHLTRLVITTPDPLPRMGLYTAGTHASSRPPADTMQILSQLPNLCSLVLTPHRWLFGLQQLRQLSCCSKLTELRLSELAMTLEEDPLEVNTGGVRLSAAEVAVVRAAVAAAAALQLKQQGSSGVSAAAGAAAAGGVSASAGRGGSGVGGSSSSSRYSSSWDGGAAAAAAATSPAAAARSSRHASDAGAAAAAGCSAGVTYPQTITHNRKELQVPLLPGLKVLAVNSMWWRLPLVVVSGRLEDVCYKRLRLMEYGTVVMPDLQEMSEGVLDAVLAAGGAPEDLHMLAQQQALVLQVQQLQQQLQQQQQQVQQLEQQQQAQQQAHQALVAAAEAEDWTMYQEESDPNEGDYEPVDQEEMEQEALAHAQEQQAIWDQIQQDQQQLQLLQQHQQQVQQQEQQQQPQGQAGLEQQQALLQQQQQQPAQAAAAAEAPPPPPMDVDASAIAAQAMAAHTAAVAALGQAAATAAAAAGPAAVPAVAAQVAAAAHAAAATAAAAQALAAVAAPVPMDIDAGDAAAAGAGAAAEAQAAAAAAPAAALEAAGSGVLPQGLLLADAPADRVYADMLRGLHGLRKLDVDVTALCKIMRLTSTPLANVVELRVHMLGPVLLGPGGLPRLPQLTHLEFYLPDDRSWEADYNDSEDIPIWQNQSSVRQLVLRGTYHAGGFFAPGHLVRARVYMPHITRLVFHNCHDLQPRHLSQVVLSRLSLCVEVVGGSNWPRCAQGVAAAVQEAEETGEAEAAEGGEAAGSATGEAGEGPEAEAAAAGEAGAAAGIAAGGAEAAEQQQQQEVGDAVEFEEADMQGQQSEPANSGTTASTAAAEEEGEDSEGWQDAVGVEVWEHGAEGWQGPYDPTSTHLPENTYVTNAAVEAVAAAAVVVGVRVAAGQVPVGLLLQWFGREEPWPGLHQVLEAVKPGVSLPGLKPAPVSWMTKQPQQQQQEQQWGWEEVRQWGLGLVAEAAGLVGVKVRLLPHRDWRSWGQQTLE